MPVFSVWVLESANITVSGGGTLSGFTQGDGTHLLGRTITLDSSGWLETVIRDNDAFFDDNDSSQRLDGAQTIGGTTYADGTIIEAEYRLTLSDPVTGQNWDVIGYNVNNSSPAYGTIEGLAFVGPAAGWPPVGTPLTVVAANEGPGYVGQPRIQYADYVNPPCFTPGTLIRTQGGNRRVETLCPGDGIVTADDGVQPLRAMARTRISARILGQCARLHPVRIRKDAFGAGFPKRDLVVSPQHRILLRGRQIPLMFGTDEVLVAAKHLVDGDRIITDAPRGPVTYLHLVFDSHQIVTSEGLMSESFQIGTSTLGSVAPDTARELANLFPDLAKTWASGSEMATGQTAARHCLRAWEARLLAA